MKQKVIILFSLMAMSFSAHSAQVPRVREKTDGNAQVAAHQQETKLAVQSVKLKEAVNEKILKEIREKIAKRTIQKHLPKMRAWHRQLAQATHERSKFQLLPNGNERVYTWTKERPQKSQSMIYPLVALMSGFALEFVNQYLWFQFLQNRPIPAHKIPEFAEILRTRALAKSGIFCISIISKALFGYALYQLYNWWKQPKKSQDNQWELTFVTTKEQMPIPEQNVLDQSDDDVSQQDIPRIPRRNSQKSSQRLDVSPARAQSALAVNVDTASASDAPSLPTPDTPTMQGKIAAYVNAKERLQHANTKGLTGTGWAPGKEETPRTSERSNIASAGNGSVLDLVVDGQS